ncbi:hypothetical protein PUN28_020102 [Cardiocondyla obscurior]|uniref:POTRA domain-containing protein n=1 Tax=Cardiocondyla obscurior TaxID=286306 RepID=A0AAW2E6I7_9HYME
MGIVHAKKPNNPRGFGQLPKETTANKYDDPSNEPFFKSKPHVHGKEKDVQMHLIQARVDKIHVDGLGRTKDDIITSQVKDLFKARNFEDVIIYADKVKERLQELECFRNVRVFIDTSKGPDATPNGVEVTYTVREMKRLVGGISTMIGGNNEGSLVVNAKAPNLLGRAERVQVEYSHGSKSSSNFNILAIKPFVQNLYNAVLTSKVFITAHDYPWSGFKQNDTGLLFDLELNQTITSKHNIQYEAAFRNISCSKQAAFNVREQCGPNLKSALRYIWTIDKRDVPVFPVSGSLMQLTTELAGLGGDIGFLKNELAVQTNWSPYKYLTFQLGLQAGLLSAISNDMKMSIADHFFLGGPLNLRGFDIRGCGPRYDGNSVGGEMYWAAAFHAYTPLPFRPNDKNFKLHGFINGGNLSNFTFAYGNLYNQNMKIFTENVRCAVGGGIAVSLGSARIELNLVSPLLFVRSDVLQQFQFGIGIQYL